MRPHHLGTAFLVVLLPLASGCSGGGSGDDARAASDTLTRRQKDSIVSTLPVPGASGVGRALEAQDAAAERARRHDSIAGGR